MLDDRPPPATPAPDTLGLTGLHCRARLPSLQFPYARRDGRARQAGALGHEGNPAAGQPQGFGRRPAALHLLIHHRPQPFVFLSHQGKVISIDHDRAIAKIIKLLNLFSDSYAVTRAEEYPQGDYGRTDPRYQGAHFDANMKAAQVVREIAVVTHATPGQIALAWLLHKGRDIVPIPGTKRRHYLEENVAAATVQLDSAQMQVLDDALAPGNVSGRRYAAWITATIDR